MINKIGTIQLTNEVDVNDFRKKAFAIFLALTGNSFLATRCVLSISNQVKTMVYYHAKCNLELIIIQHEFLLKLEFSIQPEKVQPDIDMPDVIAVFHTNPDRWVIDIDLPLVNFKHQELIEIFNTKTRDQLLHEIQIKNNDLKKTLQDLEQSQVEKEVAQKNALEKLEEINQMRKEANMVLEQQVVERTREIESQKAEIEEKTKDIVSSIQYAKRIQNAILPDDAFMRQILPESFVLYQPKDIVSGDFFSVESLVSKRTGERIILFCVVDCTGHGVPGAFMSLIGNNFLKLSYYDPEVNSPAEILDFVNQGIQSTLKQKGEEQLRDGMDVAICAYYTEQRKVVFAGAKNPLYIIKNNELIELKGDKHPIGSYIGDDLIQFTNKEIFIEGGECLYIFSDGYADQFGGPAGKKFRISNFKDELLAIHHLPMEEQRKRLMSRFLEWKGILEQVDDICILGTRL